ncbi:MAG: ABC transporter permease [Phycisphaerales bacterium]|nr:ABC transporter permease [Phycisphaerales bacterium]
MSTFRHDRLFSLTISMLAGIYVILILALLLAGATFTTPADILQALSSEPIRQSAVLSIVSCTVASILALWVAIPAGYLLARWEFPGKTLVDAIFDIPIVLPPLVVGLFLLILFESGVGRFIQDNLFGITYEVPAVILAQFCVATAFAVRAMRITYEQMDRRTEEVALVLGCTRWQSFTLVTMPQSTRGIVAAGTLAWARALGEFGPILVFAGATRGKTEVLPTTIFLEWSIGDLGAAVAVSLLLVGLALLVLITTRLLGFKGVIG